jgi:hypothetical protein
MTADHLDRQQSPKPQPPKALTASELGFVWLSYMADSMACQLLTYLHHVAEDVQIKEVLAYALHLSQKHVQRAGAFLQEAGYPKPIGFTEEDVRLEAPRLFSDGFVLLFLSHMGGMGAAVYGKALSAVAKDDIHQFYMEALASSAELCTRTKKLLLEKGLFPRSPYLPPQKHEDMVDDRRFLAGLFGDIRPLTALEVSNISYNMQSIEIVKTLQIAFAQVAEHEKVKALFLRGKQICMKQGDRMQNIFKKEELPLTLPRDLYVTNSTIAPFSDKLMMFVCSLLIGAGLEQYAFSLSTTIRRDIGLRYDELLVEMQKFSEDAAELMVEQHWLEQPPLAADRKSLVGTT